MTDVRTTGLDAAWDALNAESFYTGGPWLRAFAERGGMHPHVAWSDDGSAAALAYDARSDATNPRYTHAWLYEDALRTPVEAFTLLGGCSGYAGHLPAAPGASAAARRAPVRALLDALGHDAALLPHLTGEEAADVVAAGVLPGRPVPVLGMVTAAIDLRGMTTPEDHLASLSRTSRSGVRRDLRRIEASGVRVTTSGLAEVVDEVAPLLGQVQAHHGHDGSAEGAAAYLRLCAHGDLARHAFAVVARLDGEAVAFALGYRWGSGVAMRVSGLRYDVAAATGAYFATYFYEPVRIALEAGCTWVDLGGEALESKTRRGAHLVPRWALSVGADVDPAAAREVTRARLADLHAQVGDRADQARLDAWDAWHARLAGTSPSPAR
ncbi:hypothetical protein GCM10023113_10900 [Cellulomonas oligotrophica]|uniref:BioF2-like acetyltransferase domain-containing protein n=1 Tax=Cellulomonas oligotrophica TaxID=931536 RepID=A0ABQ4D665_9CELL|nr:hypothetical protein Col01nite_03640 [Cellulomonas oligotrophica]